MSGPAAASLGVPTTRRRLTGWGRTAPSACDVAQVRSGEDIDTVLAAAAGAGRTVVARGLARSYGDAAQCAGGVVIDTTALDGVLEADLEAGWVRVGAGASLDGLMRSLVPRGWFVPVTPGTRFVTVGGAIAADIHGKNHHRDGSFCSYVTRLSLATPTGRRELSPDTDPDLFWATAGGMGLTGVVVEATVRLIPIETSRMLVDTERADDLDDCMARMTARDDDYRYSVAWIDCLARGRSMGRAVLTRAVHARRDDLSARGQRDPLRFDPAVRVQIPVTPPSGLLNPVTVAAFNEVVFRTAPRRRLAHPEPLATYFHPLDGVGGWNRLYGPRGFLQYQFVVPFGAEEALRDVMARLSARRVASFLAVLKRFGPGDAGHLSFPAEGWTLALDLPIGAAGLGDLLDGLDDTVAAAGGRVYLAKDSRLRPDVLETMYPRLGEWRAVCAGVDPGGTLGSDLGRRLGVSGPPSGRPTRATTRRPRARRPKERAVP